ncbi:MAG: PEGA domain-containing protein [Promethearchaeota archaeon]
MRIFPKLILCFVILVFLLVVVTFSISGELIEPTRTLESSKKTSGKISVFSEPSGLNVYLDDSKIGKTPIFSKEVTSGVHILRIKDTEKAITILSGKSLQLSLFKDSLIEIPEKKAKAPTQPKLEEKMSTKKKKPDEPTMEKKKSDPKYDPLYYPWNPTGPVR